ncbi:hypothetical protein [Amycolatopsis jiangsuensis]|uniref:NAD(P)-dependent dehydrogenase (Short-subunit alcohol dehydrogenase family) n=1 Tax=Amycolatopsis jiangsuensis TaxID=1181879 RepID=A0A840J7T2_9PSEU|nr:hypothetical protein [Amycolatopsis jiangsuensis]MBB4689665.1 NAD(P)-dependent dehydrogenase (short-subunit alcohol dehydrogenase family) [Amycolatopsis jiangsuensis]
MNAIEVGFIDRADVSDAVLSMASEEARYVTGTTHGIDAGALAPSRIPHG